MKELTSKKGQKAVSPWIIERGFRSLMFIMIAGGVVAMLGSLIDSIFIGNCFGATHMAAFGYAAPVFIIFSAVAGLFSEGGKIFASVCLGEGKIREARGSFTLVCLVSMSLGLCMMLTCLLVPEQLAELLGAEGELIRLSADYIRGVGIGAVPIVMMQVLSAYIGVDNGERFSFFGIVAMTVVNVLSDWIVVTVLPWGLFGIGLATTVSYLAALGVELCYFLRKERLFRFTISAVSLKYLKSILLTGLPIAIIRGSASISSIFLNNILFAVSGDGAVSAFSLQTTMLSFSQAVIMGEISTLSVFGSMFYGERNRTSLRFAFMTGNKYGLILSAILGVVIFGGAPYIAGGMLDAEAEILRMAADSLRYLALSLPSAAIALSFMYFYLSTKRYTLAYTICLLRNMLKIVIAWLLSEPLGVTGVWASIVAADVVLFAVLGVLLFRYRDQGFPDACMALPGNFGLDGQFVYERSMPCATEALMDAMGELKAFCTAHGIPERRAMRIYLSIEEMAGNVIEHAYKGEGKGFVDIRVVIEGERISVSIRDNGRQFNPLSYKQREEQYGIRLICGLCKNIQYHYIAGINHLTIVQ